jgi:RNA polymerase sigma-70 factor, ECF subfamily
VEQDSHIQDWYHEYNRDVFGLIYMTVQDFQQAEDLTHDTFLKAYRNFDTFHGSSSPKTWLLRIARHVAIDYMRKKKPVHVIMDFFTAKKADAPLPEESVAFTESQEELHRALGRLKASYRDVIILRKIKELSIRETAEILEWKESRVKTTLHRALQQLQSELEKEGYVHETTS